MGPGTQNMHIWPVLKDPDFSKNPDFFEGRGYKIDAPIYIYIYIYYIHMADRFIIPASG